MNWGASEMRQGQTSFLKEVFQIHADAAEKLELDRWKVLSPSRALLMLAVEEAARRAESFARLEIALTRLH